jgi:hypothetical protein
MSTVTSHSWMSVGRLSEDDTGVGRLQRGRHVVEQHRVSAAEVPSCVFLDQRPRLVPLYRNQMRIAGVTSLHQKKKVPLAHAFSNRDPETNAITKEPAKNKLENNFCEHKTS